MLEELFTTFGAGAVHKMGLVFNVASQVGKTFEQEFKEDKNAKNAAIDATVLLLQKQKEV